ncbi:MAG: hypothetical protein KIPDCIKN_04353 [Haliscomenobacter sp.]|nr:hypothetical protein [Haliscomenobacter sp.]
MSASLSDAFAVVEAMRLGCACFFPSAPDQVVELRIIGSSGKENYRAAGWFNDIEALVQAAALEDIRGALGVYVTLNPLHQGCLARSNNRLMHGTRSTSSDRDVSRRAWLPIDIDPVRPSGVSSTDEELVSAVAKAKEIIALLEGKHGYPPGIRAHSGNGIHLLYRIDLPADQDSKSLVSDFLKGLDALFSDDKAKVDTTVANAARIWKLPGSTARKGQSVEGRPHRQASIIAGKGIGILRYADLATVPVGAIESIAAFSKSRVSSRKASSKRADGQKPGRASAKQPRANRKIPKGITRFDDLPAYLDAAGIAYKDVQVWDGGTRIVLEECIFDASHTGSSASLGRTKEGVLFYKCQHESCSALGWKEARAKIECQEIKEGPDGFPEDPWEIAKLALRELWSDDDTGAVYLRRHRETYYRYVPAKHCYLATSDDAMCVALTRWAGGKVQRMTRRTILDVMHCLAGMVTTPEDHEVPFRSKLMLVDDENDMFLSSSADRRSWVSLENGIVDLDEAISGRPLRECLIPCTPEWFSTVCLPFAFPTSEAGALCPRWESFLLEVFEGDQARIDLLQEIMGLCFFPTSRFETGVIFTGIGRNGKSTILQVIRNLLGETNVSSLGIEQLASSVMVGELRGKLANICADMSEIDNVSEGLLKSIISGDLLTADRKFKSPLQFAPTCKMLFATNVLPRLKDTSLGIWRRMVILPFTYIVPEDHVDNRMIDRLCEELDGIFVWSLRGAQRLFSSGKFTSPDACKAAKRQYRIDCFPIMLFIEECCQMSPSGSVIVKDLYRAYKQWGASCGLSKPKPLHAFFKDVLSFVPGLIYDRMRSEMVSSVEIGGMNLRPSLQFGDITTRDTDSLYR